MKKDGTSISQMRDTQLKKKLEFGERIYCTSTNGNLVSIRLKGEIRQVRSVLGVPRTDPQWSKVRKSTHMVFHMKIKQGMIQTVHFLSPFIAPNIQAGGF